jgi:hypothetical protein
MSAMPKPDSNAPATKADLANLVTKDELKSELKILKSDLQAEMKSLRSQLQSEMKDLKSGLLIQLAEIKADIAFRMYGALVGQMAITLAAVYFIVHNLR